MVVPLIFFDFHVISQQERLGEDDREHDTAPWRYTTSQAFVTSAWPPVTGL
jgi:hypothetical protein